VFGVGRAGACCHGQSRYAEYMLTQGNPQLHHSRMSFGGKGNRRAHGESASSDGYGMWTVNSLLSRKDNVKMRSDADTAKLNDCLEFLGEAENMRIIMDSAKKAADKAKAKGAASKKRKPMLGRIHTRRKHDGVGKKRATVDPITASEADGSANYGNDEDDEDDEDDDEEGVYSQVVQVLMHKPIEHIMEQVITKIGNDPDEGKAFENFAERVMAMAPENKLKVQIELTKEEILALFVAYKSDGPEETEVKQAKLQLDDLAQAAFVGDDPETLDSDGGGGSGGGTRNKGRHDRHDPFDGHDHFNQLLKALKRSMK
jgi:hypothetical protein